MVTLHPFTSIFNITINCFRIFESGPYLIELHMERVEFHVPQNSLKLIVFRILRLVGLQHFHSILPCTRVWDWHLIKCTKPFMYLDVDAIDCGTPLMLVILLIVELLCQALTKIYPSVKPKQFVRHVQLFLPCYKVEEMNPSLKPKPFFRHVKLFLPYYTVEESEEPEDPEPDDVYVALVDDHISTSVDEFDE